MATRGGTTAGNKAGTRAGGATEAAGAAGDAAGTADWAHAGPASTATKTTLASRMRMDIERNGFMRKECAPTAHCVAGRTRTAIRVTGAAPVRRGGQGAAIIEPMDSRWKPSVTVAAIIERDGRFLLVEEETAEGLMLNNPAGHLEPGESPAQGCARETLEETGHRFRPTALLG